MSARPPRELLARHFGTFGASARDGAEAAADRRSRGARASSTPSSGIGEVVADALVEFFAEPHNEEMLDALLEEVDAGAGRAAAAATSPVAGKTVVFTGTLDTMTRDEAKAMAERLGAKVAGSVSKKTDIVVAGPAPARSSPRRRSAGVQVIDEDDWFELVGQE